MLEKLYLQGYLFYDRLILHHLKELGLTAEEAIVLIQLLKDYQQDGSFSVDHVQEQVLIPLQKIDQSVTSLMERRFYDVFLVYDEGNAKENVSFAPFFEKLEKLLDQPQENKAYDIEKANRFLSETMNRVLTSYELEILQSLMFEEHYTLEEIQKAVSFLVQQRRVVSLRTITQMLAEQKNKIEIKKEAPSVFKEFYSKL